MHILEISVQHVKIQFVILKFSKKYPKFQLLRAKF